MKAKTSLPTAIVDIDNVKYSKGKDLGIGFSNEIDAWARMEFNYRQQIKRMRARGRFVGRELLTDSDPLVYAMLDIFDWRVVLPKSDVAEQSL